MGRGVRNCQLVYRVNGAKMCVIAIHILEGWGWYLPTPHETAFIARCESLSIAIKIAFKHSIEYASENLSRTSLNANVID
jgi:hypothetical protein